MGTAAAPGAFPGAPLSLRGRRAAAFTPFPQLRT
jgi:hypothetical protein